MKACNLCKQSFDENDPLWPTQKRNHEKYHQRTTMSTNQILGIVKWIQEN